MISSSPSLDWTYSEDKAQPFVCWVATIAKALPTGWREKGQANGAQAQLGTSQFHTQDLLGTF